jgi:hypothetical protein
MFNREWDANQREEFGNDAVHRDLSRIGNLAVLEQRGVTTQENLEKNENEEEVCCQKPVD